MCYSFIIEPSYTLSVMRWVFHSLYFIISSYMLSYVFIIFSMPSMNFPIFFLILLMPLFIYFCDVLPFIYCLHLLFAHEGLPLTRASRDPVAYFGTTRRKVNQRHRLIIESCLFGHAERRSEPSGHVGWLCSPAPCLFYFGHITCPLFSIFQPIIPSHVYSIYTALPCIFIVQTLLHSLPYILYYHLLPPALLLTLLFYYLISPSAGASLDPVGSIYSFYCIVG